VDVAVPIDKAGNAGRGRDRSGGPSGRYELSIGDSARAIRQLRVVAFFEGALAASSLAAVTEGG
jgi:hypothetical protein